MKQRGGGAIVASAATVGATVLGTLASLGLTRAHIPGDSFRIRRSVSRTTRNSSVSASSNGPTTTAPRFRPINSTPSSGSAGSSTVSPAAVFIFAFIILRVSRPDMGLLFSDLSMQDSANVVRELDSRGIRYETRGDAGQTILAPRPDLAKLRMDLAGKGLPTPAGVGYEIFDEANALGQTDFVQQLNRQRALEGELARTIRALDGLTSARAHLVLPKRQLFEEDAERPSASGSPPPATTRVSARSSGPSPTLPSGSPMSRSARRTAVTAGGAPSRTSPCASASSTCPVPGASVSRPGRSTVQSRSRRRRSSSAAVLARR